MKKNFIYDKLKENINLWSESMLGKVDRKYSSVEDTFSITMELQRPLLKDEDDKDEEIIKHKKYRLNKKIKFGFCALIIALFIGTLIWIGIPYKAGQLALDSLVSDNNVEVKIDENITFTPKGKEVTKGFIFYPGAKVESKAYAPLCRKIAENGYEVVILHMPLNFALFAPNRAEKVIKQHENIKSWVIGGHSLGGIVASKFAENNNKVDGVVFLASYPLNDNLKELNKKVVSIWGSKDGVVSFTRLIKSKNKLPKDTKYVEIEGANHSQFGDYGKQKGDYNALISREKQLDITSDSIVDLLENIDK